MLLLMQYYDARCNIANTNIQNTLVLTRVHFNLIYIFEIGNQLFKTAKSRNADYNPTCERVIKFD